MKLKDLITYQNGNCKVTIHPDGTKEREYPDGEVAKVDFPESIDLKITNFCRGGCSFCHESSTPSGKHAKNHHIRHILEGLPKGVEIAIGGGNPFDHPLLEKILHSYWDRFICNVTVNAMHLKTAHTELNNEDLYELREFGLINGLGISYVKGYEKDIFDLADKNTVVHFIAGIHRPQDAAMILKKGIKILVLGFKQFGRGKLTDKIQDCINQWKMRIGGLLSIGPVVSFDNLALRQLSIKHRVGEETWNKRFMGDDGKFTFYVDAVKMEYAVSSTSERKPLGPMTAIQAFRSLQC